MQRILWVAMWSLMLCSAGCGPKLSTVTGTVTLDGKPTPHLIVAFSPTGGGTAAAATTDAEGKYKLSSALGAGVQAGAYKVSITTDFSDMEAAQEEEEYDGTGSDSADYEAMAQGDNYDEAGNYIEKILPKYNTATTLTADVVDGENDIPFELDSKKKR